VQAQSRSGALAIQSVSFSQIIAWRKVARGTDANDWGNCSSGCDREDTGSPVKTTWIRLTHVSQKVVALTGKWSAGYSISAA
jgi:hypothetical protein